MVKQQAYSNTESPDEHGVFIHQPKSARQAHQQQVVLFFRIDKLNQGIETKHPEKLVECHRLKQGMIPEKRDKRQNAYSGQHDGSFFAAQFPGHQAAENENSDASQRWKEPDAKERIIEQQV